MFTKPLAYFLTFCTYGSRLHGRGAGSVDRYHNKFGQMELPPDPLRVELCRSSMRYEPYLLDSPERRQVVLQSIIQTCRRRRAVLLAVHVRVNHVHVICRTSEDPLDFIQLLKSAATKRLRRGLGEERRTVWAEGGSRRYLWTPEMVLDRIHYVLNEQGAELERWVNPTYGDMLGPGRYLPKW